jgi:hypothetical protein
VVSEIYVTLMQFYYKKLWYYTFQFISSSQNVRDRNKK